MHFFRIPVVVAVLFGLVCGDLPAQKKKKPGEDEGYLPVVVPDTKKKKKDEDVTQTLPPPKELPIAVLADTDRLTFQVSPLSSKGLFTPQTFATSLIDSCMARLLRLASACSNRSFGKSCRA